MFYWVNLESQKFDSGITDAPWDETSYSKYVVWKILITLDISGWQGRGSTFKELSTILIMLIYLEKYQKN